MMDFNDPNCVQRRVRPGSIDVHPTEKAIIVNYELEASLIGDLGDTMLEESKECQKIIRVKSLNESTDVGALANGIIQKCDLISPSKYKELRTILQYLKTRKDPTGQQTSVTEKNNQNESSPGLSQLKTMDKPSISLLDEYIELLYEDLPDKIKSSWLILQLARHQDNLIELTTNQTLICALARVLREDGKKSLDLSTNIICIFSYFSNFSQFHSSIIQFKVGAICFDLVETELIREETWFNELNEKRLLVEKEYNLTTQTDYEKSFKKYQLLIKKQNPLLRVAVYLLLNLSEDTKVEIKMVKKGIIPLLIKILERDAEELLLLVVTFLKKLSIYLENKNQMKELKIMNKLAPLLSLNNENIIHTILLLMNNLVFDFQLRTDFLNHGLYSKLMILLSKERNEKIVLSILYQISRDDKSKSLFNTPDHIKLILNKVINTSSSSFIYIELMALAINLAINKRNAQLICEQGYFNNLISRAFENREVCVYKIIRNISFHDDPIKMFFLDYHEKFMENLVQPPCDEVLIESLAILSNLTLPQINWEHLFKKYDLIDWVKKKLKPGNFSEDDVLLQIVILIGTAAIQIDCAKYFIENDIVKLLVELLSSKQEDDEMVLQIVFVFYAMVKHTQTIETVINDSQVPSFLIDLIHDKNTKVKRLCNATLDFIAEQNAEWASKIKIEKFCSHNKQWLEMIKVHHSEDEQSADIYDYIFDEAFGYPNLMLKTDLLNDSSSDNQSDIDQSVNFSLIQALHANQQNGLSNNNNNNNNNNKEIKNQQSRTSMSRPHTGYKIRVKQNP